MLIVETIGRIRREHLGKGKSIKEISRSLHLSRNTVRRILRSGETAFSYDREVQPRPKLGPWTEALDRLRVRVTGRRVATAAFLAKDPVGHSASLPSRAPS
jgi:AraC-like DNA-binding protein